jgi:hypothetical protein
MIGAAPATPAAGDPPRPGVPVWTGPAAGVPEAPGTGPTLRAPAASTGDSFGDSDSALQPTATLRASHVAQVGTQFDFLSIAA